VSTSHARNRPTVHVHGQFRNCPRITRDSIPVFALVSVVHTTRTE
jgi:hypothetical protein